MFKLITLSLYKLFAWYALTQRENHTKICSCHWVSYNAVLCQSHVLSVWYSFVLCTVLIYQRRRCTHCDVKIMHVLTHWGRVRQICVNKLYHHWFRWWLVAWTAPSHYLNQCWNIVNRTLGTKCQWNLNRQSYIFIQENAFENIVGKIAGILPRPQCVKNDVSTSIVT